jgi:hypothetical protein
MREPLVEHRLAPAGFALADDALEDFAGAPASGDAR